MKRPPYTFLEMQEIERHAERVMSGVMGFCDGPMHDSLRAARYLIAELRHASGMLVDASDEDRQLIARRLVELFKERPE